MAPRSAARSRGNRKARNRKWSRSAARDRQNATDRPMSADYYFDSNDAGEPMLSWAQAQQTVKLGRPQSSERFTIANELPMTMYQSSPTMSQSHRDHQPPKSHAKSPRKKTSSVPTGKASYDITDRLQMSVDQVAAPPDALQEAYVCDEEDHEMLKLVNCRKKFAAHGPLRTGEFEEAITLLERESIKFRGLNTSFTLPVDEDAVCSVCQKGDCDNTNMILFCDMCNLAVHQECYGVPYIPEGQWHCRRCMVSPSGTPQCVLCPNSEGALKQTEDGRWAHVICALYIPKVNFKSTQLLEPVMNIDHIEKSRWKLRCVICKSHSPGEKKVGACIQCEEKSCKVAFHVTCAQKAGFHMDLKPTKEDGEESTTRSGQNIDSDDVKGVAYCKKHSQLRPRKRNLKTSSVASARNWNANKSQQQSNRMDSLNIEPEKLFQIAVHVKLDSKPVLFNLVLLYWKSKRRHRNGLPLLKRPKGRNNVAQRAANHEELERQRLMTSSTLHRLEKLRTSMEYQLRKDRTDFKRDKLSDVRQGFEVMPAKCVLDHVFERIRVLDKDKWFAQPVTEKIAPHYFKKIHHPMDFATMSKKLDEAGAYSSFESFEADVNLIIDNCLTYNQPDTVFHKFALTFREQVKPMLEDGSRDYKEYVTDRSRRGSSVFNGPTVAPVAQESGANAVQKKTGEDDLLSEISAAEDNDDGVRETAQTNGDANPLEENPIASASSSSVTCSSPLHSRTIPCSPKQRKTPVATSSPPLAHQDDSNDFDSGPNRKKIRTTPAEAEETNASSSRVPTPPPPEVPRTPLRPAMGAYRSTGRLGDFLSESEPDPPFPSEDSTDHPSDIDQDSDGPAHRLRRKRRFSVLSSPTRREYINYQSCDFVWVRRKDLPTLPAIIMDDRATKGININGHIIPAPPQDIRDSLHQLQRSFPGQRHLVYFLDAKPDKNSPLKWAWVTNDQLDLLGLDDHKDSARLKEATGKHMKEVKKAYDFAKSHMPSSPHRIHSSLNGLSRSPT